MHAMQYEITLPADYDMGTIRKRVADKCHLLDAHPGLGLKAYLLRERGLEGSPVNQYAPFYLWRTAEGMNSFLWGSGFRGLSADFGRPVVHHWLGTGLTSGAGSAGGAEAPTPTTATRETVRLPESTDPAEAVERALAELPAHPALHTAAVAVDPSRWELLRFALWHGPAPEDVPGARYQVLHLSRPELDRLPSGRHW
ncbi:uncharacterized protein DUF4865 [Streptomyces sp. 1114.5]|uniref:DUF4865 family protein n=1 Tax=Streptomyces sp. 1114.5 TaxID=1938830 RepID=UPI000EB14DB9|nr:DUF4865 family protein [Streptomyces sp. 1114.5]RKT11715.1 uncharacterized protein DUF4865 [Streptomyces sp. 1114.5]